MHTETNNSHQVLMQSNKSQYTGYTGSKILLLGKESSFSWYHHHVTLELGRDREDSEDFHNKSICRASQVSDDQCA